MSNVSKVQSSAKVDDANLALLYSRLAALEDQRDSASKQANTSASSTFSESDLTDEELLAIDSAFDDIVSQYDLSTESDENKAEMFSKLQELILNEERTEASLITSIADQNKSIKSAKTSRDIWIAETHRLRKEIDISNGKIKEFEEICRNFQSISKEKNDLSARMLQVEVEKSAQLNKECSDSIARVTSKMQEEIDELNAKETENMDLALKLDQFKHHLDLKRQKQENEMRARDLEQRYCVYCVCA